MTVCLQLRLTREADTRSFNKINKIPVVGRRSKNSIIMVLVLQMVLWSFKQNFQNQSLIYNFWSSDYDRTEQKFIRYQNTTTITQLTQVNHAKSKNFVIRHTVDCEVTKGLRDSLCSVMICLVT